MRVQTPSRTCDCLRVCIACLLNCKEKTLTCTCRSRFASGKQKHKLFLSSQRKKSELATAPRHPLPFRPHRSSTLDAGQRPKLLTGAQVWWLRLLHRRNLPTKQQTQNLRIQPAVSKRQDNCSQTRWKWRSCDTYGETFVTHVVRQILRHIW